jgi:4-amino-4-deoxy-L-arabinose transferase-like glycosyltransferase
MSVQPRPSPDADRDKLVRISLVVVLLAAALIYLPGLFSSPFLLDDVDAVQAQIARNMLTSGDWVTARIDGVPYFEKSPLIYWLMAVSYRVFGVHDWAARIPIALSSIALAWLTFAFGAWAFGRRAGYFAGLAMGTCTGLWLFTRILIPDCTLTLFTTLAIWAFLRIFDARETRPRLWAYVFAASLAMGLLLKSLVAVVFPVAGALLYLFFTRQLFSRKTWRRLHPLGGLAILVAIAAPWHVLATIRNPPYFAWTLLSAPGHYHGFLWFYVINEQLLRFLNLRYPRDYNTVPRLWFWLFHLVWLFPWSVYLPAVAKLPFKPVDRAGHTRLMALCFAAFVLIFFTFSTTQEYYSMPCYPALALLAGSAIAAGGSWIRKATAVLSALSGLAFTAVAAILILVRRLPAPGDITAALSSHPGAYSLSLGHMEDLTLASFAYLRVPLAIAGVAFLVGCIGTIGTRGARPYAAAALMMVIFFQAARIAMAKFDPLLSSRDLAERINHGEPGRIVVDHHYYTFSSIAFYTGQPELLLNGRWNNFEYGSNAPGAPHVFLDDAALKDLWGEPERCYLIAKADQVHRFDSLLGTNKFTILAASGGKVLLTNRPVTSVPRAAAQSPPRAE